MVLYESLYHPFMVMFYSFRCSPSCLFAALLPFWPWKQMQSTPIHSVCHSICEGLLLVPHSSGCPMFLGSPQPSQQNHGKQSIPQSFSAVVLCCIHLMFLLFLFFFCSGCTSNFSHCESIITSRVANTKNILDIFRPCYAKCTVYAAFGRIYHGRIEVADGIFQSLQLLGYLTQEQACKTVAPCCSSIPLSLLGSI